MKQILISLALLAITSLSAMADGKKIGYVLPEGTSYSNGTLSGFPVDATGKDDMPTQTPELNAAQWFKENYVDKGTGAFVALADLATVSATDYDALWINIERVSYPDQTQLVGHYGFTTDVINNIKKFSLAGGNLYLSKMAVSLCYSMGRIGYAPNCENAGAYDTKNADDWFCTQPKLGCNLPADQQIDNSNLEVFAGLEKSDNADYWHNAFKMTNAEVRLANLRCSWNDYKTWNGSDYVKNPDNNGDKTLVTNWQTTWNAEAWTCLGNIGDYCYSDITYFKDGEFDYDNWGKVVCNGATSCQWAKSNDGTIPVNVTKLTANILKFVAQQATPTAINSVDANALTNSVQAQGKTIKTPKYIIRNGVKYNYAGQMVK